MRLCVLNENDLDRQSADRQRGGLNVKMAACKDRSTRERQP